MDSQFEAWLVASGSDPATAGSRVSNLRRVELAYGDLDELYALDRYESMLADLAYSTNDAREGNPNRSRISISGDAYNGLATLRSAVAKYRQFREEVERASFPIDNDEIASPYVVNSSVERRTGDLVQTFSMERDLQGALRRSIEQLEDGLTIVDGGGEHVVQSGKIDILAQDAEGARVVIELKAVRATRDAVAQVLAYMGDVSEEFDGPVRGILVAPDFDAKATSASRVVPTLRLVTYGFSFTFAAHP